MQISGTGYMLLKPGTTGLCCFGWGKACIPVVFKKCDGVHVWIEGRGIRPKWHIGLHYGLLATLFSWDVDPKADPE